MDLAIRVDHRAIHRLIGNACVTAALIVAVLSATLLAGCSRAPQDTPPAGPYRIIELFDGDSFNLKAANGATVRVRIAGIDAPEKKQPYSVKAKESLEALLSSGDITLDPNLSWAMLRSETKLRLNGLIPQIAPNLHIAAPLACACRDSVLCAHDVSGRAEQRPEHTHHPVVRLGCT